LRHNWFSFVASEKPAGVPGLLEIANKTLPSEKISAGYCADIFEMGFWNANFITHVCELKSE
jgi:hypothetical protein